MPSKSSTTTKPMTAVSLRRRESTPPIHPGEILREEFLEPMGLSVYRVAKDSGIPSQRLNDVVLGRRSMTAATAVRLARYFGTSDLFWMNLQSRYDLDLEHDKSADSIVNVRPFVPPGAQAAGSRAAHAAAKSPLRTRKRVIGKK